MTKEKTAPSPVATHSNSIESIVKKTVGGKQEVTEAVLQLEEKSSEHTLLQNQWFFNAKQQLVKSVEK
jgi:hypothetical protein